MTTATPPAASGSSFYLGMKVLPAAEREAMFEVYRFCREVDDIADDQQVDRRARARELDRWRRDIDNLYAGREGGLAAGLALPIARFGLDRDDFMAVIDGMAMDVERDICWPTLDLLDLYCDRVASAVGRLSVRIFGMEREPGVALAHHLGRALQLTNILRDIDEDAAIGRIYLPIEPVGAAGMTLGDVGAMLHDPRIDRACREVAAIATLHYSQADDILAARPRGHLLAPKLMAATYARLLRRMEKAGWAAPRRRVRHNKLALLWIFARMRLSR
ncbi:presqualene diphosphate synthase HpnD [Rhizorhabdus argentea]|uniref:presqualene diphosphate synthase HpnD n=1 Tax=Rhizorhabdus argentea TaxID=1387174 RepID=UPI0030ECB0D3